MIPLFVGLTLANLLCLCTTAALGYGWIGAGRNLHVLCGALSTLVCVAVHCVVFTYFIATAKWVQHAVLVRKLDPQLTAPTRSFKMQAFPWALLAMGSVFLAAVLGAARDNGMVSLGWHHIAAIGSITVNLIVAVIELRAIDRNGRLIDLVLAQIGSPGDLTPSIAETNIGERVMPPP